MFTIKRRFVYFIYIAEYTLKIETVLCKRMFSLPVTNFKSQCGLATRIYPAEIFILNESAIWLITRKSRNMLLSPRGTCRPYGAYHAYIFRPGRRTTDHIFLLKTIIDKYKHQKSMYMLKKACICFLRRFIPGI